MFLTDYKIENKDDNLSNLSEIFFLLRLNEPMNKTETFVIVYR